MIYTLLYMCAFSISVELLILFPEVLTKGLDETAARGEGITALSKFTRQLCVLLVQIPGHNLRVAPLVQSRGVHLSPFAQLDSGIVKTLLQLFPLLII